MPKTNKANEGFYPMMIGLGKVFKYLAKLLKPEELKKLEEEVECFKEKKCLSESCQVPCWTPEGFQQVIKGMIYVKMGRPIESSSLLTLDDLKVLAIIFGMDASQRNDVGKQVLWNRIVKDVKEKEDSKINRLKRLWGWLEPRLEPADINWLMIHVSVYWTNPKCYLKTDWRMRNLTAIFNLTDTIKDVVEAKLNYEKNTPAVSDLPKALLLSIANRIMGLELSKNATKEFIWQEILQKIETDKDITEALLKNRNELLASRSIFPLCGE